MIRAKMTILGWGLVAGLMAPGVTLAQEARCEATVTCNSGSARCSADVDGYNNESEASCGTVRNFKACETLTDGYNGPEIKGRYICCDAAGVARAFGNEAKASANCVSAP